MSELKRARREPPAAQVAMRAAIDRALRAELSPAELRVFLVVLREVPMFDKVEDRIANSTFAAATGISARHVRRALARLHETRVIRREPGRTLAGTTSAGERNLVASLISLKPDEEQSTGDTDLSPVTGDNCDANGGQEAARTGDTSASASESFSESSSESLSGQASERADAAVETIARRRLDDELGRAERGERDPIRSRHGFLKTIRSDVQREHAVALHRLALERPEASADELVDLVDRRAPVIARPPRREGPCDVCGARWEDPDHWRTHSEALDGDARELDEVAS